MGHALVAHVRQHPKSQSAWLRSGWPDVDLGVAIGELHRLLSHVPCRWPGRPDFERAGVSDLPKLAWVVRQGPTRPPQAVRSRTVRNR